MAQMDPHDGQGPSSRRPKARLVAIPTEDLCQVPMLFMLSKLGVWPSLGGFPHALVWEEVHGPGEDEGLCSEM